MPPDRTEYHDDIIHAHRQAIAALRELLATEENRTERRRLATTLLRARPVKDVATPPALARAAGDRAVGSETHDSRKSRNSRSYSTTTGSAEPGEGASALLPARRGEGAAGSAAADEGLPVCAADPGHDDNLDNPNHPVNRQLAAITHEAKHGPDHLGALRKLEAIMKGDFSSLATPTTTIPVPLEAPAA